MAGLDEIMYTNSPISEVVLRVDFMSDVASLYQKYPAELKLKIAPTYKLFEKHIRKIERIFRSESQLGVAEKETPEWNYYSVSRQRRVAVAPDYFFISHKDYTSFDELHGEFVDIITVLAQEFPDLQAIRCGLRYINHITKDVGSALEWSGLIHENLLSGLNVPDDSGDIVRHFNEMVINYDTFLLVFKYGLHNVDFPAPITDRKFILDFDANHDGPLELNELSSVVNVYHDKIQMLFEESVQDGARNIFRRT